MPTPKTGPGPCVVGPEQPCDVDELRTLFLFEKLSDDQLRYLCEHGAVQEASPGRLFLEGDPADCFYVLLDGEIALDRRVGDDDVEFTRTSQVGVYAGAWGAFLGDPGSHRYLHSARVLRPSRLYVLSATDFRTAMLDWFPMAMHLLEGVFQGNQSSQRAVAQRERLLALGSLSAGLTHELNNPAAAAVRATEVLRQRVGGMRQKLALIAAGPYDRTALATLIQLQEEAVQRWREASGVGLAPDARASAGTGLGALETADHEDALADWFDDHGVSGGWDLAPVFVQAGIDGPWLDKVVALVDDETAEGAVRWIAYALETEQLVSEVSDATTRISSLVGAAKQYSQIGRAPYVEVDVHELLDSTLVMLDHSLGTGITVVKRYDRTLPRIHGYPAELNQVWTNLIENAAQAMGGPTGQGTLTVTTRPARNEGVEVEIEDTGTGIPPEVLPRIFEPFFTTKPVGSGTGLGLDISWRIVVNKHHGDIMVDSEPGSTRFRVKLPVDPGDDIGAPSLVPAEEPAEGSAR